ncbi:hydroxyacid dehydrogenase [bacterium]|nr:hydroxyacid dehydrogenase [bacterium]
MDVKVRVLVCDGVAKKAVQQLTGQGFEVEETKALAEDDLIRKLSANPAECLIVRSSTKVTRKVFESVNCLKLVGRAGVGVDNIDVKAATGAKVKVMNTPGGNSNAVIELTVGFILCLARQIPKADRTMKEGRWEKKTMMGIEVKGKVLGLVGVGRIGCEVARRARALGMEVLGYDPYLAAAVLKDACEPVASLQDIYRRSDFISIHTPLTDETRGLVGSEAFALMKDGVRIVNAARGGILDEEALLKALNTGKVAGAALDVYSEEPPRQGALLEDDRLILTPHIGAATGESQDTCADMLADQVIQFFAKNRAINVVN